MKWIGQHIYDLISRFRNDVYLEDVDTGTIASGGNLGLDSNNKIVKATVSSGSGDITGVTITTDSGAVNAASQTSGSADFAMVGTSGVGVTNSSETITVTSVPGEIDHDSLLNYVEEEHYDWESDISSGAMIHANNIPTLNQNTTGTAATVTGSTQANITSCANLTTVGTIGTGTWQGTAIATDQQKHLAYFDFKGYGTTDGTNYERQQIMTDNKAPFLHSLASGTDGLDDLEHYEVLRLGAHVMPRAGVLKKWQGWASSAGTGTINMSIVKATPVANTTDDVTPVLVKNTQFTAVGNSKVIEIDETSFSVGFAEGDMLYTVVLGSTASKLWYLSSTVEVEWT